MYLVFTLVFITNTFLVKQLPKPLKQTKNDTKLNIFYILLYFILFSNKHLQWKQLTLSYSNF